MAAVARTLSCAAAASRRSTPGRPRARRLALALSKPSRNGTWVCVGTRRGHEERRGGGVLEEAVTVACGQRDMLVGVSRLHFGTSPRPHVGTHHGHDALDGPRGQVSRGDQHVPAREGGAPAGLPKRGTETHVRTCVQEERPYGGAC